MIAVDRLIHFSLLTINMNLFYLMLVINRREFRNGRSKS
jgi:hypothetical protein